MLFSVVTFIFIAIIHIPFYIAMIVVTQWRTVTINETRWIKSQAQLKL